MSASHPKAIESLRSSEMTLSATTGREQLQHMARVRKAELFDYLIGGSDQGRRNGEAEHPRGPGVDDQLELGRLHDRQIRRLRALEDAAGIDSDMTKRIRNVGSVAHQPPISANSRKGYVAGSAWRDAKLTNWARRLIKKASRPTNAASGRSRTKVAKAASISRPVLALSTWICSPIARAAVSASLKVFSAALALAG